MKFKVLFQVVDDQPYLSGLSPTKVLRYPEHFSNNKINPKDEAVKLIQANKPNTLICKQCLLSIVIRLTNSVMNIYNVM